MDGNEHDAGLAYGNRKTIGMQTVVISFFRGQTQ